MSVNAFYVISLTLSAHQQFPAVMVVCPIQYNPIWQRCIIHKFLLILILLFFTDIARQPRNEQHSGYFSNPTYQSSGERPAESNGETHETAYESIEDVKAKEIQKNPEHDYAIPVKQAKVDSELEKPEHFYYVLEKENSETA